ncbi:MAG: restriction endonuclease subunit S [Clostridia bacterium]|nr:restriction endonuclease subunit S [Clostridia bacterium]
MELVCLKDLCENSVDVLKKNDAFDIEYIDISSVNNISKKIISTQLLNASSAPSRAKQLVKQGDILVSTVRPNLNAVAMVNTNSDETLVASTGFCVLRYKKEVLNKYIFYFCQSQSFIDDMVSQATGASYPAVTSSIVKSVKIPFVPMEAQKKIVEKLDKITDLINKRKEQLSKMDELVKARFVELFGDININDRGWDIEPLGNLCDISRGGSPRPIEQYLGGTIPWIKIGDATKGDNIYLHATKEHIIQEGVRKSRLVKKVV